MILSLSAIFTFICLFFYKAGDIKGDIERAKSDEKIKVFMLEKIKEHEDTYDENNIRDFIDLYIQVARDEKDETKETFTGKHTYVNAKRISIFECIIVSLLPCRITTGI